jgi:uroporphyrinogen decarboxylase
MSAPDSLFVRAAKAQPTERTPFWFMRQAGRYMAEYRAIRKQYSLIEICKRPAIAAQVTIEAAEILQVDAAIIFADLLLPLEVMGLPFHFSAGEGPKIEKPIRTPEDTNCELIAPQNSATLPRQSLWSRSISRPACRSSDFAAPPLRSPAT